jgi:predicted transcriptional regulator
MLATPAGRRYNQLLEANSAEILELAMKDDRLRKQGLDLLERVIGMVEAAEEKPEVLDKDLISAVEQLAKRVERKASPALKEALAEIRSDLKHFEEKTIVEGLEAASRGKAIGQ